ncbi:MAG: hypothetical protein JST92_14420 [Deltaproteobacteria bacterium]|nr:hypothetical protein [Deltaproteobacteria bacterium]
MNQVVDLAGGLVDASLEHARLLELRLDPLTSRFVGALQDLLDEFRVETKHVELLLQPSFDLLGADLFHRTGSPPALERPPASIPRVEPTRVRRRFGTHAIGPWPTGAEATGLGVKALG